MNQRTIDQKWTELREIQAKLAEEKAKGSDKDAALVAQLEHDEADKLAEIDEAQKQLAMAPDTNTDTAAALNSLDAYLDQLEIRRYVGNQTQFSLLSINLKKLFLTIRDEHNKQLQGLKDAHSIELEVVAEREKAALSQLASEKTITEELRQQLFQRDLEAKDAEKKRDAAVAESTELKEKLASSVSLSIMEISDEDLKRQEEELEKQLKKERTIYDVEWVDDIKRTTYKAKYAMTGEPLTFGYLERTYYYEIPADEVPSFRIQYEPEPATEAETVAQDTIPSIENVEQGEQFQAAVQAPTLPAVEARGSQGQQPDQSVAEEATITAGQLEERLARFASEYGLVKGNVA